MKNILSFQTLVTGKLVALLWNLQAMCIVLSMPISIAMYFSTSSCPEYGHKAGWHLCAASAERPLAAIFGIIIGSLLLVLISRIAAELVVVVFRIYEELRRANR